MKYTTLEKWLKFIIVGMAACGAFVYNLGILNIGSRLFHVYPQFTSWYCPWLVFLLITVIPCYVILIYAWKIADNIGKGNAFSYDNGKAFRRIFLMAATDTVFFFVGNIIFLFLNLNHPAIFLVSMILVFLGIAIAVCAKVMSHLVDNAAALQEESNWTI